MEKKRRKISRVSKRSAVGSKDALALYSELAGLKQEILKAAEYQSLSKKRILDLEIHINLLTRLLTTLCIERFGMRALTFKKLVRRIEKEAFRDSQIMELESLYSLTNPSQKRTPTTPQKGKDDPWDQIS